ncbi:hypothetical protein ABT354_15310 [Streptomyces sp. NPDC000594]|uniref:hypothetical protein n=1 Tax=Streptomyces sp. NPDC000594 TaxID=3154261 RepID=UPI00332F2F7F
MQRKWVAAAVGGCLVAGLGLYAGGFFDEEVGSFGVQDVCESYGPDREVVARLKQVLLKRSAYNFYGDSSLPAAGRTPISNYSSFCYVRDKDGALVSMVTRQMRGKDSDFWLNGGLIDHQIEEGVRFGRFKAGYAGVSSSGGAAIHLPCFKNHPEAMGSLSVSVALWQGSRAAPKETKAAAEFLVRRAAAFAHQDADCDLPSRL